ncbi:MAG TPA: hypothetical protein VEQ10_15635 [Vicinamibacteria bacterium]|nr:hypothetical protein [Vicinamibacteria bacterium]
MSPSSPRLNLRPPASASRPGRRPAATTPSPVPTSRPPGTLAVDAALKVLVAGVDKDTRSTVEASVRGAFVSRPAGEPWTVSLVQLGGTWSVRVEGPRERGEPVSFTVDTTRLVERLRAAVETGPKPVLAPPAARPAAAAPFAVPTPHGGASPGPAGPVREPHTCERCQQHYVVAYERLPDEPQVRAAVACPHCWGLNFVEIGDWAAAGHDYSAEKS